MKSWRTVLILPALLASSAILLAQEPSPTPTPAPAVPPTAAQAAPPAPTPAEPAEPEAAPPTPWRPPEGTVIINLPSAQVPPQKTLTLFFTHRFSGPVQGSDIHDLFSFDSGADVNIGLWYVPVKNLEVGFMRARALEDYEFSAKYAVLSGDMFRVAARVGLDYRSERNYPEPTSFFAQTIWSVEFAQRVRLTVVPTFSSKAAGQRFVLPIRNDIFNVPVAVSVALTRSINVQGEVVPRCCHSPGTGWIVALEKTLLRHRFSFTAGNLRQVTVDQYISSDFNALPVSNIYLGFNITRQWQF